MGLIILSPLRLPIQAADHPAASHLILLIGLPGSGKSTIAQDLVHACPQRQLISTDAIRATLFGDEAVQGAWLKVRQEVERQLRQAVEQAAVGTVSEAILDATHAVRKQRRQAIALARQCGFTQITGVWVNSPLALCLERNQKRERRVPVQVILDMHRCLVGAPPGLEEGLDKLIQIQGRGRGL